MAEIPFDYQSELPKLPEEPGVYRYFDVNNEIIYVGKAKISKIELVAIFIILIDMIKKPDD